MLSTSARPPARFPSSPTPARPLRAAVRPRRLRSPLQEEVVQHVIRGIWHETERLRSLLSSRIEFSMVSVAAMAHATDTPKTNRDAYLLDSFRQMKRERRARDLQCAENDQLPCNSIQSHVSATQGPGRGVASAPRRDSYDRSKPKVVTLSDIVVGEPGGLSERELADYRTAETRFWEASQMQPVNLKAPPKIGGVAAVSIALANRGALCASQNMLAVGTTKGVLCVWTLPSGNHASVGDTISQKPLLKSQSQTLHPDDKFPIVSCVPPLHCFCLECVSFHSPPLLCRPNYVGVWTAAARSSRSTRTMLFERGLWRPRSRQALRAILATCFPRTRKIYPCASLPCADSRSDPRTCFVIPTRIALRKRPAQRRARRRA